MAEVFLIGHVLTNVAILLAETQVASKSSTADTVLVQTKALGV